MTIGISWCSRAWNTSAPPARWPGTCGRLNPGTKSRTPVPKHGKTAHCRALSEPGGEGPPSGSALAAASAAAVVAGGDAPRSLSDPETSTEWATFALPHLSISPERNPDAATEDRGRRGGDDSVGLCVRPCRFHTRGEAAVAGLGGAGPAIWSVHPATFACGGEEKQVVVGRGRLVAGRTRGSRRSETRIAGPGGTRRRLVNRGEGREPVVGPGAPSRGWSPPVSKRASPSSASLGTGMASPDTSLPVGVSAPGEEGRARLQLELDRAFAMGDAGASGTSVIRPALLAPGVLLGHC